MRRHTPLGPAQRAALGLSALYLTTLLTGCASTEIRYGSSSWTGKVTPIEQTGRGQAVVRLVGEDLVIDEVFIPQTENYDLILKKETTGQMVVGDWSKRMGLTRVLLQQGLVEDYHTLVDGLALLWLTPDEQQRLGTPYPELIAGWNYGLIQWEPGSKVDCRLIWALDAMSHGGPNGSFIRPGGLSLKTYEVLGCPRPDYKVITQ